MSNFKIVYSTSIILPLEKIAKNKNKETMAQKQI